MAKFRDSKAFPPIIIVGACLFALGIYKANRPPREEVNKGFVAQAEVNGPALVPPEGGEAVPLDAAPAEVTPTMSDMLKEVPWLTPLLSATPEPFRARVLSTLSPKQVDGTLNCRPVLSGLTDAARDALAEFSCTAKDGTQISGNFDDADTGEVTVTSVQDQRIIIEKSSDAFSTRFDDNN
jgi:hypothetical protein